MDTVRLVQSPLILKYLVCGGKHQIREHHKALYDIKMEILRNSCWELFTIFHFLLQFLGTKNADGSRFNSRNMLNGVFYIPDIFEFTNCIAGSSCVIAHNRSCCLPPKKFTQIQKRSTGVSTTQFFSHFPFLVGKYLFFFEKA